MTRPIIVSKIISLLFNMLSRLVIAFLPRSKHLLISWLQSPSAAILKHKKIVCHCFHCFPIYLPWSVLYKFIYSSVYPSIYPSSIHLPIYLSIYWPIHLSIYLIYPSIPLSIHPSNHSSILPSIRISICPSICLSTRLPTYLSVLWFRNDSIQVSINALLYFLSFSHPLCPSPSVSLDSNFPLGFLLSYAFFL